MRWRSRYSQMSFEPYGLGIRKQLAFQLGVMPVRYYDRKSEPLPGDVPIWLTQSIGEKSDWRQEREYRHLRDFQLDEIPDDDLILFCHAREDAASLEAKFRLPVIPFVQ